jgi:hypothetical protein
MGAWEVYTTALECPTAFLCIEKFRLACEEKATGGSFELALILDPLASKSRNEFMFQSNPQSSPVQSDPSVL